MRTKLSIGVICIVVMSMSAFGGDLAPPGPPASTMKTLDEVEARTPISSIPFLITESGSYYLTQNLELATLETDGITIQVDNVTLDLNGYTLIGPGKAAGTLGFGIRVQAIAAPISNIAIHNGGVRDWRQCGILTDVAPNGQFKDLRCTNNGGNGISTGGGSVLTNITASENVAAGIYAAGGGDGKCVVIGCSSNNNGDAGIYAGFGSSVTDCVASNNVTQGIVAVGGTVANCVCNQNGDIGIIGAEYATAISGCSSRENTGDGIQVSVGCHVVGNVCLGNGFPSSAAGIHVTASNNAILRNHCVGNGRGLDIDDPTNYSSQNTLSANTTAIDGAHTQGAGDLANVVF